jgi:hypothetical protein
MEFFMSPLALMILLPGSNKRWKSMTALQEQKIEWLTNKQPLAYYRRPSFHRVGKNEPEGASHLVSCGRHGGRLVTSAARAPVGADRAHINFAEDSSSDFRAISTLSF